jgi:anti-sigma factor RsiW
MSQLHLSDEILMAFADGELDEPVAAAVAKAMAEDPGLARRVVDFQQSRRLTRSAFSSTLAPDVPPALYAAVSAQVKAFEAGNAVDDTVTEFKLRTPAAARSGRTYPSFMKMALAASVAALAVAAGYFAGQREASGSNGLIAQLESPSVRHALSTAASGQDVELPTGRLRVISSYRLANGSLCREFKLQGAAGAANAIACRRGEWNVDFAAAKPAGSADYIPSDGADPVSAYLQSVNAGDPLVGAAEAQALTEAAR